MTDDVVQRNRRSLTHVGGPIETDGEPDLAAKLAHALDVSSSLDDEDAARAHVHGFHAYPARMHPTTASRLVTAFSPARGVVLDPFCGSGTVVIEAMIGGRESAGSDLNPLAVELTRCKSRPRAPEELIALVERAKAIAEEGNERRKHRSGAHKRYDDEDVLLFDPHVLLELDSIRAGVFAIPHQDPARADLALAMSAILVKVSKKSSDTAESAAPRRLAAGYTLKLFVKKTEELARRLTDFAQALPRDALLPRLSQDDATLLKHVPAGQVDAIVTSPPYAATYDYLAHHSLRARWLGLTTDRFADGEIGARRNYKGLIAAEAKDAWNAELSAFLDATHRVLRKNGQMVLLLADSAVRGIPLRADDIVASLAEDAGFVPLAKASQSRPHFHGPTESAFRDRPRAEHALLLEKA